MAPSLQFWSAGITTVIVKKYFRDVGKYHNWLLEQPDHCNGSSQMIQKCFKPFKALLAHENKAIKSLEIKCSTWPNYITPASGSALTNALVYSSIKCHDHCGKLVALQIISIKELLENFIRHTNALAEVIM